MELDKFKNFTQWMTSIGLKLSSYIEITMIDSYSNYGVKAVTDIKPGTCLFTIPRTCLLSVENSSINTLLNANKKILASESGWIPLLLALAYETTQRDSKWRAYLDAVPNFENLTLPIFWTDDELQSYCKGTGVVHAVINDNIKIQTEFHECYLPFVIKHSTQFNNPLCREFSFYKQLVAFVMAYSFTEPDKDDFDSSCDQEKLIPFMVPMADMLNHSTPNNAALIFGDLELKMEAVLPISAGEEIFNTYGDMANWQLLHMHGFSLPPSVNTYDSFEISLDLFNHCLNQRWQYRWKTIKDLGIQPLIYYVPVDLNGFMNTEEIASLISTIFISDDLEFESWAKEAQLYYSNHTPSTDDEFDPWESTDEESARVADLMDSLATLPKLPTLWKTLLAELCSLALKEFGRSLSEEEAILEKLTSSPENNKHRHALYVRISQMRLLQSVLNAFGNISV